MENLRPGPFPASGESRGGQSGIPLRKAFPWPLNQFYTSRSRVRAEVISCERQLSGVSSAPGRDRSPTVRILARAAAAIFPLIAAGGADDEGDGGGGGRWVGVCALLSEAQVEASAIARAPAVERMTSAAVFLLS